MILGFLGKWGLGCFFGCGKYNLLFYRGYGKRNFFRVLLLVIEYYFGSELN